MTIIFDEKLSKVSNLLIVRIPLSASKELSSRGMVMVKGTMNDITFRAPLEPDGKGSHWLDVSSFINQEMGVDVGSTVSFNIEQTNEWIEPDIPEDIMVSIIKNDVLDQWNSITTRSRWEWIRWIRSTKNSDTRNKRIHVACSKLFQGDKNPCCFDTSRCTVPDISKSGVLFDE